jgi:hypothetical protein
VDATEMVIELARQEYIANPGAPPGMRMGIIWKRFQKPLSRPANLSSEVLDGCSA